MTPRHFYIGPEDNLSQKFQDILPKALGAFNFGEHPKILAGLQIKYASLIFKCHLIDILIIYAPYVTISPP